MKKIIFAIIPARGGSKSIPNKNMASLAGKPLIYYSIKKTLECKFFNKVIVSTDSSKIIKYSKKFKNVCVIKRPKKFSQDKSPTIDSIIHACDEVSKKFDLYPNIIFVIEPTSPFRKKKTLSKCLKLFSIYKDIDSVVTVKKTKEVPLKIKKNLVFHSNKIRRRQDRKFNFFESSTVWATTYKSMKKNKSILGKKVRPLFVDTIETFDINEKKDLKISNLLMKSLKK